MKTISCENFSLQSSTLALTATTDTIVKCCSTGKQYEWTGSIWKEYFGVVGGNNVNITGLVSSVPKGSIASNLVINSPHVYPVVAPLAACTSVATLPVVNVVYGIMWIAPCTGTLRSLQIYSPGGTVGTIEICLYDSNVQFIAKTGMNSTGANRIINYNLTKGIDGSTIPAPTVTGGQIYFVSVRSAALASLLMHPVSNASISPAVQVGYSATTTTPGSLAANANNVSAFPYIAGVFY